MVTKLFVLSCEGLISVLSGVEDEEGDAALEEQEALKLQRQMAEQLDDQDFGLDIFKVILFVYICMLSDFQRHIYSLD